MSHRGRLGGVITACLLAGCATLGLVDNGTHLAYALEAGARELRASDRSEYIVRYEPLGGVTETYGRHRGGTDYHERFVFTPLDLHITKTNAVTEVILRKMGDRIDVVELR